MNAPQNDALVQAVAEHGPFPMPTGDTVPAPMLHAGPKACGTCKSLVRDGKAIEHEQCAARAVLLLPPDQPAYEDLVDLTDEQRKALPTRFHTPVFDGLGKPNAWLCQVCWGDGWVSQWPCGPAQQQGALVFESEVTAEDIATEMHRLHAELDRLSDDVTGACLARHEEEQDNARLRLALASAKRGRSDARAEFYGEQAQHRTTVEQRNAHVRELVQLRARVAELETEAICPSQMTTSEGTSKCARRPGHRGDHRNGAKNQYWDDDFADASRDLRPGADAARRMIRDRQATEDPHDSPLHHTYTDGRDLPEVTR